MTRDERIDAVVAGLLANIKAKIDQTRRASVTRMLIDGLDADSIDDFEESHARILAAEEPKLIAHLRRVVIDADDKVHHGDR